jgi:protein arginine kinase
MIRGLQCAWVGQMGPQQKVVLSTRVRLARNLDGYPFPNCCRPAALGDVLALLTNRAAQLEDFTVVDMYRVHPVESQLLVERHLISPAFAGSNLPRGLVLSEDSRLSLMLNEEDHLRLQCLMPGLQFETAWKEASRTEEFLAEELSFAFDDQFGYLTSCPSNAGTGLRASAMLHLPALAWINALDSMFQQVAQLGLTVRGIYGEGSPSAGHLVQISNQVTLGPSEEEIIAKISAVCEQVIQFECSARQQLIHEQRLPLEDRCWRSLAILRDARLLESGEAMDHISMLRLGVDLEILPDLPVGLLNDMLVRIRPAGLQMESGHELNAAERDVVRARLLRNLLRSAGG